MSKYDALIDRLENSGEVRVEAAIVQFTEELCRAMDEDNVSRSDLAKMIGTTPAYITKVLSGHANFTLATMTKLAQALNRRVHTYLCHKDAYARMVEVPT